MGELAALAIVVRLSPLTIILDARVEARETMIQDPTRLSRHVSFQGHRIPVGWTSRVWALQ